MSSTELEILQGINVPENTQESRAGSVTYEDLEKEVDGKSKLYFNFSSFITDNLQGHRLQRTADDPVNFLLGDVQSKRGIGRTFSGEVRDRIHAQVQTGEPLHLALIAIAHKNPNPEISGGRILPDIAELRFILQLQDIITGIEEVYPPGADFTVLTEGSFYLENDPIFDVTPETIEAYEAGVRQMAEAVSGGKIILTPLQETIGDRVHFLEQYAKVRERAGDGYLRFVNVMERSITPTQKAQGITAEDMARKYRALHDAKYIAGKNGSNAVYDYLADRLGQNFIYCSVTGSERPEVLNIDPSYKSATLPQHGLGILKGGGGKVVVEPFKAVYESMQRTRYGSFVVSEFDMNPMGYINYGARRKK